MIETNDGNTLYVCPECGGASVVYSALAGGLARCNACEWEGSKEALLAVPAKSGSSPDEVLLAMRNDIRNAFAKNSEAFITFLVKWGFVPAIERAGKIEIDKKLATRFVSAIAAGALSAVFEERQKVERERASGN